jgi:hypothetical protein
MAKFLLKTDPVLLNPKIIVLQIDLHLLCLILLQIKIGKSSFKVPDQWLIRVVRVEIRVRVDVLNKLAFAISELEISDVFVNSQVNAGRGISEVAVVKIYVRVAFEIVVESCLEGVI